MNSNFNPKKYELKDFEIGEIIGKGNILKLNIKQELSQKFIYQKIKRTSNTML